MPGTLERSVARPKGRPKRSERNDRTARIDSTVLGWVEMIAKAKGITVAEYLTETVRGPAQKDFARLMEQMRKEEMP